MGADRGFVRRCERVCAAAKPVRVVEFAREPTDRAKICQAEPLMRVLRPERRRDVVGQPGGESDAFPAGGAIDVPIPTLKLGPVQAKERQKVGHDVAANEV